MVQKLFLLLSWFICIPILSQTSQNCIEGIVLDIETNKPIESVRCGLVKAKVFATTDSSGHFKLCGIFNTIDSLTLNHLAYQVNTVEVRNGNAGTLYLISKHLSFNEVVVTGNQGHSGKDLAVHQRITQGDVFNMPTFLGEADVVRSLQQLPGVQSVSEGVNGIFVRGGGAGQNMVTLDKMELMNPVHLMGIYSVFNPLTTESADIYKGNSPVEQRSKTSSSIKANTFNPMSQGNVFSGSIGNLASNLSFSVRSKNKKIALITGFRRSYMDLMKAATSVFVPDDENYFNNYFYSFYDFNGKLVYKPGDNTTLSVGWYFGKDEFSINKGNVTSLAANNYGNKSLIAEFKTYLKPNFTMSSSITGTQAWSAFGASFFDSYISFKSEFSQVSVNLSFTNQIKNHNLKWGFDTYQYRTIPHKFDLTVGNETINQQIDFFNDDISVFIEDGFKINEKWSAYLGVRVYKYWNYDSIPLGQGLNKPEKSISNYTPVVPITSVWYHHDSSTSFNASYSYNIQFGHLASLSSVPLPNDIWVMSSANLKPETAHQLSFLYKKTLLFGSFTSEIYGKLLDNLLIYNVNTNKDLKMSFNDHFFKGIGKTFGIELSFNKDIGRFTGMINYTLSRSKRSYEEIFDGTWFNDKFDRIHDLSIVGCFKLNNKWDFSANWVYATGNTTTLPAGRFWTMGAIMNDYAGYNTFRLPSYHRLDISANWHLKSDIFKQSVINLSIINLYNRSNPYFVYYDVIQGDSKYNLSVQASQTSLFPIMPSINWRFTF